MSDRALYFVLLLLVSCRIGGAQGLSPATPAKEYIRFNGQVIAVENALPSTSGLINQPDPEKAPSVWTSDRPAGKLFTAFPSMPERHGAIPSFALLSRSRALFLPARLPAGPPPGHEQASLLFTRSWLTLWRSSDRTPVLTP